ncbi:MAG: hypothetical protein RIC32_03585 [Ekhidna sp.]|jgi:hypothetical protein
MNMYLQYLFYSILFSICQISLAQNCDEYRTTSKSDAGDLIESYGSSLTGSLNSIRFSISITQVNQGSGGTFLVLNYSDRHDPDFYKENIKGDFTSEKLKRSYVAVEFENGEIISFENPTECSLSETPETATFGDASYTRYNVFFMHPVSKKEFSLFRQQKIKRIVYQLGDKSTSKEFDTSRKKDLRIVDYLYNAFNCIDLETIYELKMKSSSELVLTEVSIEEYSDVIIGTWGAKVNGVTIEMHLDSANNALFVLNGDKKVKGTYKISGSNFIFFGEAGNQISPIKTFLADMIVIEDSAIKSDVTYTRIE